jgi:hypothetical protein
MCSVSCVVEGVLGWYHAHSGSEVQGQNCLSVVCIN